MSGTPKHIQHLLRRSKFRWLTPREKAFIREHHDIPHFLGYEDVEEEQREVEPDDQQSIYKFLTQYEEKMQDEEPRPRRKRK